MAGRKAFVNLEHLHNVVADQVFRVSVTLETSQSLNPIQANF